jgi:hypothetical protein
MAAQRGLAARLGLAGLIACSAGCDGRETATRDSGAGGKSTDAGLGPGADDGVPTATDAALGPGSDDGVPPDTDAAAAADDAGPDLVPGADTDGDGLDDVWEYAAGDGSLLSYLSADTDGDGTPDGAEDPDGDGLTNLEELAFARLTAAPAGASGPHPFQVSLVVELDAMSGLAPSDAVLAETAGAFAALPVAGVGGQSGVGLHVYRDEASIAPFDFDGSFAQRFAFLSGHPPAFGDLASPPIPYGKMVHAAFVTQRTDIPARGAEVVTDGSGVVENTGLLVYATVLAAMSPQCGIASAMPPIPDLTLDEALASSFVHELGHVLQLGHDTTAGGAINYFNVMSVPMTCMQAQMRFNGAGNTDATLGATEAIGSPRFSDAAAALLVLGDKLSVDTSVLEDTDGWEM